MVNRVVLLGLLVGCLVSCDGLSRLSFSDTRPNKAWKRCQEDPCSDGCPADYREIYCEYYIEDPKCNRCWPPVDAGEDSAIDGGDGGGSECKRDLDCDTATPRCFSGACESCTSDADCAGREATPACDAVSGVCVPCTSESDGICAADGQVCKTGGTECVQCNVNDDCPESAPRCGSDNECGACVSDADCGRWGKVCDEGECVQCTPDTELDQCPDVDPAPGDQGPACDPIAKTCTGQPRGSVSGCGECITDSECHPGDGGAGILPSRCLPMTFGGTMHGNYCLRVAPSGLCPNGVPSKQTAASVLGVQDDYCFPREMLATCEAILDFGEACAEDSDCGAAGVDDGLCIGSEGAKRCTYACSGHSDCSGATCAGPAVESRYCDPS